MRGTEGLEASAPLSVSFSLKRQEHDGGSLHCKQDVQQIQYRKRPAVRIEMNLTLKWRAQFSSWKRFYEKHTSSTCGLVGHLLVAVGRRLGDACGASQQLGIGQAHKLSLLSPMEAKGFILYLIFLEYT